MDTPYVGTTQSKWQDCNGQMELPPLIMNADQRKNTIVKYLFGDLRSERSWLVVSKHANRIC